MEAPLSRAPFLDEGYLYGDDSEVETELETETETELETEVESDAGPSIRPRIRVVDDSEPVTLEYEVEVSFVYLFSLRLSLFLFRRSRNGRVIRSLASPSSPSRSTPRTLSPSSRFTPSSPLLPQQSQLSPDPSQRTIPLVS